MRPAKLAIAILLLAGCADERASVPDVIHPVPLTIWNSTQRELEEVRVHDTAAYATAANLLAQPLPDDARVVVQFLAGQRVTVIRRNVDGGKRIAFSTAWGLDVRAPGWVLQVFQESFRLHAPDLLDSLAADDGETGHDGGDPGDDGGDESGDDDELAAGDDGGGDP